VSVDLFYDSAPPPGADLALAVEMEAATLFTLGAAHGVPVACVLAVSDIFEPGGQRRRIEDHDLLVAAETMAAAAISALA